jgi:DNA primase
MRARKVNSDVPLISEETIQRVTEANDIVDVVGSYFPLKRAGTSFRALCPFHREKTPSFHVNPSRQTFHCFGCGAGGGVLRFVMDYEHLDFPSAVRRLAERAGIPVLEGTDEDAGTHNTRKRLLAIQHEASLWFHHQLMKSEAGAAARDYLAGRGIGSRVARDWGIGFAPDSWDALLDHLRSGGFRDEELAESGLATSKGDKPGGHLYSRFRNRVMFPVRNDYGEVVAFSGRTLESDPKAAKYVNSPETPVFTKGKILFGLDKTKRDLITAKTAIVCEGQLDLITAFEAGVRHVTAPQGTAFTAGQARLLARFVETVILCFDADNAGREAVNRSLPALLSQGLAVKVAVLPRGEDPDSLVRSEGAEGFLRRIDGARDYFDHAVEEEAASGGLEDPAAKSRLVRRLGPPLALIGDAVLRESLVGRLALRLSVPQSAIRVAMRPPRLDQEAEEPEREETISLSPDMGILCRLAVADGEVRNLLRGEDPLEGIESAAALVDKIARADYEGAFPPPAVTGTLSRAEERYLAGVDTRREIAMPVDRAREILRGFRIQRLQRSMETLKSRLAAPNLPADEREKIQKQILDLKIRVADVQRPFA